MSKRYSKIEEILNGITHGIGAIFGVVALTILLVLSILKRQPSAIVSFSIYGASIILMYTFSKIGRASCRERV